MTMLTSVDASASHPSPEHVDRVLRALGRECSSHDSKLGRWLLQGFRVGVHRLHGYGSFREYAERVFGFTGRSTEERLRVSLLAEAVLSGDKERDAGRSAYQVALTVCESCRHATQEAGGEPVAVDEPTVAMAECDAQRVGRVDAPSPERASQTIPPRVRRAVLRRHHDACAVPGCTHGAFVHVHHIELRSEGGAHDAERMLPLCSAHHRAVHDGRLAVSGTYSEGFAFTHADGSPLRRPAARCGALQRARRGLSDSGIHGLPPARSAANAR
jgi:5-methylcytosine-specific restriction endonuclease McrA